MTLLTFTALLFGIAYLAGILGALTGLGGGIILMPTLVIFMQINIYQAMGASLLAVMTVSSATALVSLQQGYTNVKIGMFLETAVVIGALMGAALLLILPTHFIMLLFGMVLLISAYASGRRKEEHELSQPSHPWAVAMQLNGTYPTLQGKKPYAVQNVPAAWTAMFVAGILSSLLGIGSGILKVLAMDQAMGLPYKVATATSNFMIGMTAAASLGIYFIRGYIDPILAFPVVTGVFLGSLSGVKILHKSNTKILRIIFSTIIIIFAIQMIYKGLKGLW